MKKKELCENSASIAYYSGFNGLEVKPSFAVKSMKFTSFPTLGAVKRNIIDCGYIKVKTANT